MGTIVVTGGAGFAGSHIVDAVVRHFVDDTIVILDKMTYAADVRNVMHHVGCDRASLAVGDVADLETCLRAVEGADLVIHAAAESHVDKSFGNSLTFTRANVLGTHCLMEACRAVGVPRIVHVSTDEVYGEVHEGAADENMVLRPTNPYSSSKAAAEMIVRGYRESFGLPVVTLRANNLYGSRQYPEKIMPRFLCNMMLGRRLPVHGDGRNVRHYLAVPDFAAAVVLLSEMGVEGEAYNLGTSEEFTNNEVAAMIAGLFGRSAEEVVQYVPDRPFNDRRYAVDSTKIRKLGWRPARSIHDELPKLRDWYRANLPRYATFLGIGTVSGDAPREAALEPA